MSVSLDVATLRQGLARKAAKLRGAMVRSLNESALLVRARAVPKAPVSTGQLRNSIQIEVNPTAMSADVKVIAKHGPFVEYGTRAHFPPPDALLGWVMRTFGVDQKEGKGIAFTVARKIAKKGTPAQPFLFPALAESNADIKRIFNANTAEALNA